MFPHIILTTLLLTQSTFSSPVKQSDHQLLYQSITNVTSSLSTILSLLDAATASINERLPPRRPAGQPVPPQVAQFQRQPEQKLQSPPAAAAAPQPQHVLHSSPGPQSFDTNRQLECGFSVFREELSRSTRNRLALAGEFPWQVTLHNRDFDPNDHECGGTIISDYYILTAAHCVVDFVENVGDMRIVAGHLKVNDQKILRRASRIIPHQHYDSISNENDIALIRVSEPFDFASSRGVLNAACLPPPTLQPQKYIRGDLVVAGWGSPSGDADEMPLEEENHLMAVSVPLIEENICKSMYGPDTSLKNMICAGISSAESGLMCSGESGGPLIGRDVDNRAIVLGIASWGYGCPTTGFPAVYTDVRKYIDWIIQMGTKKF